MAADQKKILKNLPDGVIICRHLIGQSNAEPEDIQFCSLGVSYQKTTSVKFFNSALKDLLGLKSDFNNFKLTEAGDNEDSLIIRPKEESSEQYNQVDFNSLNQSVEQ